MNEISWGNFELCILNFLHIVKYSGQIFDNFNINVVFHSAAYKHVSLVEQNPIQGLNNNFFSTQNICSASIKNNVERVVLISSDKAVRPTNVLGASKRLAELVVQAFAEENKNTSISTNIVCPNGVDTEYRNTFMPGEDKSKLMTVHGFAEEFCKLFDNELKNNGKIFKI